MKENSKGISERELRYFGLVTGVVAGLLFGLLLPWLFGYVFPLWPWGVASFLVIVALLLPAALMPFYRGWMIFGYAAGWINTRIILGVVFFFLILPAGLVMRLLGKDPMARKLDANEATFRVTSRSVNRDQMRRPF
jgi:hypothetical protein